MRRTLLAIAIAVGSFFSFGSNADAKKSGFSPETSVKDYLKSLGVPSELEDRREIATKLAIENYQGTAAQNIELLKKLKEATPEVQLPADKALVPYMEKRGMDSHFSARRKLAWEIGIVHYRGTAKQNIAILEFLVRKEIGSRPTSATTTPQTMTATVVTVTSATQPAASVAPVEVVPTESAPAPEVAEEAVSAPTSVPELAPEPTFAATVTATVEDTVPQEEPAVPTVSVTSVPAPESEEIEPPLPIPPLSVDPLDQLFAEEEKIVAPAPSTPAPVIKPVPVPTPPAQVQIPRMSSEDRFTALALLGFTSAFVTYVVPVLSVLVIVLLIIWLATRRKIKSKPSDQSSTDDHDEAARDDDAVKNGSPANSHVATPAQPNGNGSSKKTSANLDRLRQSTIKFAFKDNNLGDLIDLQSQFTDEDKALIKELASTHPNGKSLLKTLHLE